MAQVHEILLNGRQGPVYLANSIAWPLQTWRVGPATQGANTSAAMVLTLISSNIMVSAPKGLFNQHPDTQLNLPGFSFFIPPAVILDAWFRVTPGPAARCWPRVRSGKIPCSALVQVIFCPGNALFDTKPPSKSTTTYKYQQITIQLDLEFRYFPCSHCTHWP